MEARYVNLIRTQLFLLARLPSLLLANASLSPWGFRTQAEHHCFENLFSLDSGCLVDTKSTTLLPEERSHCPPLFSWGSWCETRLSEAMRLKPPCYYCLQPPVGYLSPPAAEEQPRVTSGGLFFLPVPAQGQ